MELNTPHKHLCDKILKEMRIIDKLNFLKFRDLIYELFIYNLDISECLWYIIYSLIETNEIGKNKLSIVLLKTYNFLKYFNNNYRPIYHLENYLFYLVRVIHEL